MLAQLSLLDLVVLIVMLLIMPTAGIIVALRKKNATDYFLAGRNIRWWTVAGSVFGTNISSFHLIGMLGIGYSIGFVQAHYEIVFPAILLLCFVFLASYRRLDVFTLSQYLEVRYNEYARLLYTVLLIMIILVQLVGSFYVGSITLQWLLGHSASGGTSFALSYWQGLLLIGLITCSYTIWGGMESIVITDTIQTVMMLAAGFAVAYFTLSQPEIGGFTGLLHLDAAQPRALQKMHLYLPSNHPNLPWTGIFTGLLLQHCFNFTTNQFLVQRVLAANSDRDARLGIIASGFMKLTIPFFSIAAGVAAYYLFEKRFVGLDFNSDNAFLKLVETVIPRNTGLVGMILAGLVAATFSSVDSMMNAATTLLTVDVYQKYMNPKANDRQIVRFGRQMIVVMVVASIGLALWTYTPDRTNNFMLKVSAQLSYFTPGIMVAFFVGILWRGASARAAVWAMALAPVYGVLAELLYNYALADIPAVAALFGQKLNFMHRVFVAFVLSFSTLIVLSRTLYPNQNITGFERLRVSVDARQLTRAVGLFLLIQAVFIGLVFLGGFSPKTVAVWAAIATFGLFIRPLLNSFSDEEAPAEAQQHQPTLNAIASPSVSQFLSRVFGQAIFWAGLLTAFSVGILYYFA